MSSSSLLSAMAIPTDRSSLLQVRTRNITNDPVVILLRALTERSDGSLQETVETFTVTAAQSPRILLYPLTDGRLLTVSLQTTSLGIDPGQIFSRVAIQQGSVANPDRLILLTSGYLASGSGIAFPQTSLMPPLSGSPQLFLESVGEPGPGVEIAYNSTANARSCLRAGKFELTTTAVPASRIVTLVLTIDTEIIYSILSRTAQLISQNRQYVLWSGSNLPADNSTQIYFPIPDFIKGNAISLNTTTAALNAADVFSNIDFEFERWAVA